jgi:uncharacterized membrane protein YbhN (UPF0104 family)
MPRWLKPLLGLALLVGMVLVVNPEDLARQTENAQWGWFAAGLVAAVLANVLCAFRWQQIARAMKLEGAYGARLWRWFSLYLQGVSVNSVLPGGIIGGDVWRASQFKPLVASGQAVFLERLSGLWGLFCLSALATLWPTLNYTGSTGGNAAGSGGAGGAGGEGFTLEAIGAPSLLTSWEGLVWLAAIAPLVLRALLHLKPVVRWKERLAVRPAEQEESGREGREAREAREARLLKLLNAAEHPLVLRSLPVSILSQWLTVLAFWSCMVAAGASLGLAEVTVLASAVFLLALVPASLGGFGAREAGAVFFLAWVGVNAEAALLGSVLFGLTATLQGLAGLVGWMRVAR